MVGSAGREIYIGRSRMGNRVCIDVSEPLRMGVLSSSGGGKTVALTNTILQLSILFRERISFVGLDPKLVSLHALEPRFSVPVVTEPSQWLGFLMRVEQVMNDRLREMQRRNWVKIDPWEHGGEFSQIIVVVEELPSLVGNPELSPAEQKAIVKWFDTYLTRCRSANMGSIICSHSFSSADAISSLARSQLRTRLIGRCGVNEAHLFNEGQDDKADVVKLSSPGEFYLSDKGDTNSWVRMRTWHTDERRARELAEAYAIDARDVGLGWKVESPWG